MVDEEIEAIERRRLRELEKQAALHGPDTEPAVLIEILALRHKYGTAPAGVQVRGNVRRDLDFDFLMNTVAAALQRLTAVEDVLRNEARSRPHRQTILNIWLGAISFGVVISILLALR